MIKKQP